MLILTRKKDQEIKIGDDITVVITQIKGEQVRIGIKAPQEVAIYRSELLDKKENTNVEPV